MKLNGSILRNIYFRCYPLSYFECIGIFNYLQMIQCFVDSLNFNFVFLFLIQGICWALCSTACRLYDWNWNHSFSNTLYSHNFSLRTIFVAFDSYSDSSIDNINTEIKLRLRTSIIYECLVLSCIQIWIYYWMLLYYYRSCILNYDNFLLYGWVSSNCNQIIALKTIGLACLLSFNL